MGTRQHPLMTQGKLGRARGVRKGNLWNPSTLAVSWVTPLVAAGSVGSCPVTNSPVIPVYCTGMRGGGVITMTPGRTQVGWGVSRGGGPPPDWGPPLVVIKITPSFKYGELVGAFKYG